MEAVILTDIPFKLEFAAVKNHLHLAGDDETTRRMAEILERVRLIARPKALYREAFVDERGKDYLSIAGQTFHSRLLHSNLAKVYRVFPYVATCGVEIDIDSATNEDILERYWLDGIKEIVLREAIQFLREFLKRTFALPKIASMNPGSLEDWPLGEQKPLFAVLGDVQRLIGVQLTESSLMIPVKSVSGIIFPTETNYENCQLCSRKDCPGRRAEFDPELYRQKLG